MDEPTAAPLPQADARLRLWNELALIGQAGMETAWAGLWYAAIFEDQMRLPWWGVWLLLWGTVAVTFAMARGMETAHVRIRWRRILFLGWIALAALVTLKLVVFLDVRTDLRYLLEAPVRSLTGANASYLPFLHVLILPLVILRGVLLASALPDVRSMLVGFQTGLVAFLLHGLVFLPSHPRLSAGGLFVYLFLGLLTMSATRIAGVTNFRGGRLARLNVTWGGGLLTGALAVVAAALLLGALSAAYAAEVIASVTLAILGLLGLLVVAVLFPLFNLIAYLIALVMQQMAGLLDLQFLENLKKSLSGLQALAQQIVDRIYPTINVVRVVVPLIALGAIILAVLVWLRLQELDFHARAEEDTAPLSIKGLLGFLGRLARRPRRASRAFRPAGILAAARVRRIYASLMALCARLGAPRKASLTPSEFLPQAGALFPGDEVALEQITRAYLKVRYGEYPESRAEVEQVQAAWKAVQSSGRRKLSQMRKRPL